MDRKECLICETEFSEDGFIIHMHKVHSGKTHVCEHYKSCQRSYTSKDLSNRHRRDDHPDKNDMSTQTTATANLGIWICNECGQYGEAQDHQCAPPLVETGKKSSVFSSMYTLNLVIFIVEQPISFQQHYIVHSGKNFNNYMVSTSNGDHLSDGSLQEVSNSQTVQYVVDEASNNVDSINSDVPDLVASQPVMLVINGLRYYAVPIATPNQPP